MSTDFVVETVPRQAASEETLMAERFPRDVADHQMIPSLDDGLYRHLRFRRVAPWTDRDGVEHPPSQSSSCWFDLITWPGHLTITGDGGTYTFARERDMFEFFRGHGINPGYWAEKVRGEVRLKRYSQERFRQYVTEDAAYAEEDGYPGLAAAVERAIFGDLSPWNTEYEDGAREALAAFRYLPEGATCPFCSEEEEPVALVRERGGDALVCPEGCLSKIEPFAFTDTWEWDLGDWDWQYLWCCHAIVWGIAKYDRFHAAHKAVDT